MAEGRRGTTEGRTIHRRVWRFAGCELDESRWRLTVRGSPVDLEVKPLELLLEFLRRPGEVLTKDELLEAIWPATIVVEGSLTTAVSKLRKALGDEQILETVPRVGYRLAASVEVQTAAARAAGDLALEAGQAPPGRPQWRLTSRLGQSRANEVWLAEHEKTGERRVFKFANDPVFLRNLKREVSISRLLASSLGERPDFAQALEWNFETQPFFVEITYRGQDLPGWATSQGGLAALPLDLRMGLAIQVCAAVAAAHGVGVLHQDLKPANIVISAQSDGGWRAAVVDFGSAQVLDTVRLHDLAITTDGFDPQEASSQARGTALYLAPELLAGAPASVRSDVYALGVVLYQLVVGDLTRPLTAGWEREVTDPLLREDLAEAASGDPERRLASAWDLAERLRSLDARRAELAERTERARRNAELEAQVLRARARRPWVAAAGAALALGATVSSALYVQARHDRDAARRQSHIAEQINLFLATDLLARSNPFKSGKADETLVSAVTQAAPQIDRRFPAEPEVAANLHHTIALALDRRGNWDAARREYDRAAALWRTAEGPASIHAHVANLQHAMMEARSYTGGSLERAKAMVAGEASAVAALKDAGPEIPVWLASSRGMIALVGNDAHESAKQFGLAVKGADAQPARFDTGSRLTFLQRLAFSHIRLGDGAVAETLFRRLAGEYAALEGADSADVLMVRLNIAQALMIQGKHAAAVQEADALYPKMLATLGPEHELTMQLLSTRAQSEGALERWDAAIADTRKVHETAMRTVGPKSFFGVASLADGATAECRSGRLQDGLRDVAEARAQAHAGFPGAALENAVDLTWANCLIAADRIDEAERRLGGIDVRAVAQLAGDPDWGANVDLARAEIALSRGQRDLARTHLASATAAMHKPTAEPYQVRLYTRLRLQAGLPPA
ncbi:MAG: protein kinase domain-containing protein [Phenylobacterium sp.]